MRSAGAVGPSEGKRPKDAYDRRSVMPTPEIFMVGFDRSTAVSKVTCPRRLRQ